ncbi:SMP-30/gluconolactonase/LRE family protein [Algoriphagus halophytocola]|uniref:SMP-30/gluconolactonase/LRE family protein n=1 Tax=Algoriphagus halophytocola TaxID=2991499 RepID=A0ABY6MHD1_9BACT|nr:MULTISPECIES: SMP-30/gluconolactonase/LRE family protein [unclassified Algoriphagus]UZD23196.1 SMP-30/gluconolactonase/LRE family protein [Algoriphagus sp. TR-M5]WBL44489.1 SMP-30/gluconolactonase/LRE family protein [Algoriphagus sp. TR-M9]
MNPIKSNVLMAALLCSTSLFAQEIEDKKGIVAKNAELVKVQDGFSFTEGPAVNRFGDVYFTDQPNNRIHKWNAISNEVSVWREDAGRSNGMYFKLDGTLVAAADNKNELWAFDTDGNHEVWITAFKGKKLNGPNDLWVRPRGGLYFTDPLYPRPYWERSKESEQDGQNVYYLSDDKTQLFTVAEDLVQPNGIVGTPDSKYLYVSDIGAKKTYKYEIREDGYLINKELFCEMGSDGMTIDDRGNLYLTGDGVTVFDKKGNQIAHIPVPAGWTANVVFAALDRKTLFITASDAVYTLQMKTRGVW